MNKSAKGIILLFIVFVAAMLISYYMVFATIYIAKSRGFLIARDTINPLNVILELFTVIFVLFSLSFFRSNYIKIAQFEMLIISIIIIAGFLIAGSRGFYNTVFGSFYLLVT